MLTTDIPYPNMAPNWKSKEMIYPGMWIYKGVLNDIKIIDSVTNLIDSSQGGAKWEDAKVGYQDTIKNYRDCKDFKLGLIKNPSSSFEKEYTSIWHEAYAAQFPAVNDYCSMYSIQMQYWELMNFIKYTPGQHFQEHADHGYSYSATVSLVGYPNDDYEGGELFFPKININVKPEAGDLFIFPSTYLFSHVAKPVKSGTKYSLVTMLDYNDHAHNEKFYKLRKEMVDLAQNNSI
jgi:2OG-Fe(II) oxygenase superfamily